MLTDSAPSFRSHQRWGRVSQVEAPHLPLWAIRKWCLDGRTSTQHPRVRFPLRSRGTCGKRHASFNRSLILGHMVYSYGGRWYQTLINHTVRHAPRQRSLISTPSFSWITLLYRGAGQRQTGPFGARLPSYFQSGHNDFPQTSTVPCAPRQKSARS